MGKVIAKHASPFSRGTCNKIYLRLDERYILAAKGVSAVLTTFLLWDYDS
jgi:hypothetical protein